MVESHSIFPRTGSCLLTGSPYLLYSKMMTSLRISLLLHSGLWHNDGQLIITLTLINNNANRFHVVCSEYRHTTMITDAYSLSTTVESVLLFYRNVWSWSSCGYVAVSLLVISDLLLLHTISLYHITVTSFIFYSFADDNKCSYNRSLFDYRDHTSRMI